MDVNINKDGSKLQVGVVGRVDTTTSPELESLVNEQIAGVDEIVFDFSELEYISSAGLRLLLHYQKKMNAEDGSMVITNVNEFVLEVFEMTGFKEILTIQ